jgi:hypothetical protein
MRSPTSWLRNALLALAALAAAFGAGYTTAALRCAFSKPLLELSSGESGRGSPGETRQEQGGGGPWPHRPARGGF